ncbi:hypothetical protein Pint_21476 [Pistacia integerrima]|uniref:Uncharacterized protein n=1 Tax=Pistacia integerrima TaxID=434235 RepID=A0ACC0XBE5_9ROSI|nr:hypothetical protein Pint_21476 [Pistacia integerrima]
MLLLGVFVADEALILHNLIGQLLWSVSLFRGKSQPQLVDGTYNLSLVF